MKRNAIALICAAVIALAAFVPAVLLGAIDPAQPVRLMASPSEPTGSDDGPAGLVASGVVAGSSSDATVIAGGEATGGEPPANLDYEPGVVLVGLADGVTADDLNARLPDLDYIATEQIASSDIRLGIVELRLADGVEVADASSRIAAEDFASYAEPDYYLTLMDDSPDDVTYLQVGSIDEDALAAQTTTLNDRRAASQWALTAIHAYDAWDYQRVEGAVTVAVIDTGVNLNHEDLQANILKDSEGKVVGYNVEYPNLVPSDLQGHGTHVAGIVAADSNNNVGVSGVSYDAKIMPIRITTGTSKTAKVSSIVAGFNYAINNASAYNVRVINFSFGAESETSEIKTLTNTLKDAYGAGILVVVASGNGGTSGPYHSAPCDYSPEAIGVISISQSNGSYVRSSNSNYNLAGETTKPLSAPGGSILSTTYTNSSSYGLKDGTSMASPCVAGVAALLFAAKPELTPAQARQILLTSATDLGPTGWDDETGYGMVNAEAALVAVAPNAAPKLSGDSEVGKGKTIPMTVTRAGTGTWTWESSNPTVATVASGGGNGSTATVTGVAAGTTIISAKSGNVTLRHVVEVIEPIDISGASVEALPAFDTSYTGAKVEPELVVMLGDERLTVGEDYIVSYGNNVQVSTPESPATATVTGVGRYTGTASGTFMVEKARLSGLVISPTTVNYSGEVYEPDELTVYGPKKGSLDQELTEGEDYELEVPEGRKLPGDYEYRAVGKGNYAGSTRAIVTVKGASIDTVKLSQSTFTYDGQQKNPTVTVKDTNGRTMIEGEDYTLEVPEGRTDAGTYMYTITPKGAYKGTARSTNLKISPATVVGASVTILPTSYTYDATAHTPTAVVKVNGVTLTQGVDFTVSYSNNVNVGTGKVTVTGKGNYTGSTSVTFPITVNAHDNAANHRVQYQTHVENIGWQSAVRDGAMAGTSGRALRLEGIKIALVDRPYSGSIEYQTHVQNIGWQRWKKDGAMSGTSGQALRLEGIRIRLTGDMAKHYDVYYRVHAQNIGWMSWASNGASAGTAGYGYRLEGIQIVLRPKGMGAPAPSPANAYGAAFKTDLLQYRTHVQNVGWQGYVADGAMSGTSGRSLRLEGINIRLGSESGISGGIAYRTHVQNIGWQGWRYNNAMSGTSGQSLRLEAIQIKLTGDAANKYDVYYRVHCQNFGWMGWAKNGASAGSEGYGLRLEGIQIKLVPKGSAPPGSTANAFRKR